MRHTYLLVGILLQSLVACSDANAPQLYIDVCDTADTADADGGADVCTPSCESRNCGDDGCKGSCGSCRFQLETCSDEGLCVPTPCKSSKDCPGVLVCDKERGVCVICLGDEDCPDGEVCGADYDCHTEVPCTSDLGCKDAGMVCDKAAGKCVECLGPADCAEEQHCFETYCMDDTCTAGESHCDGLAVMMCDDDGSAESVTETCTETQYCEDGACHDQVCVPGATSCQGDKVMLCNEQGNQATEVEDCVESGKACVAGACVEQICSTGEPACADDFTTQTCALDGTHWVTAACEAEHFCADGMCLPWVCPPAKKYCDGEVAKECNDKGSTLLVQTDCSSTQQHCIEGECSDTVCNPDSSFCDGKNVNQCSADGTSADVLETCTEQQYCHEEGGEATCQDQLCAPDALFCLDNAVMKCNAQGSGMTEVEECTGSAVCTGGQCVVEPCGNGQLDPGEQCDDGNMLMCDGCEDCESHAALDLSDPSAVVCTSESTPSVSTWTVETWVRFNELYQQGPGQLIAGRLSSYPESENTKVTQVLYVKWTDAGAGTPTGYRFRARFEDASDVDYILTSFSLVQPGIWYHVAFVRADGSRKLFVNGYLEAEAGPGGVPYGGSGVHCLGAYASNDALSPNGYVDEYRVSNAVRYSSEFTPKRRHEPDEQTVILWHFDEGTGMTAADASGAGHDLTMDNVIKWTSDTCYGSPADSAVCGDGKKAVWEDCDDGNTIDGDGCSATCSL